ncbi:MAG: coproporphyrinogen III oxidase, partial [Acidobacteria bacterium]|nr:coproporphyrinogen III oxidase [Acidobacteriota bacterium]
MKESLDIRLQAEKLAVSPELLQRYNLPGPRYTSYPTAPEWKESYGPDELSRSLEASNRSDPQRPLSLYMHLPFCERLCLFCGCNVVIRKDHEAAGPYLKDL